MILQKFSCFCCCFSREKVISLEQSPARDFYSWMSLWILYKSSPNQPWEVLNLHKKLHSHYLALPNICFCIKLISAYSMCASISLQNSICASEVSEAALRWWHWAGSGAGVPSKLFAKIYTAANATLNENFKGASAFIFYVCMAVNLAINYCIRSVILVSGG